MSSPVSSDQIKNAMCECGHEKNFHTGLTNSGYCRAFTRPELEYCRCNLFSLDNPRTTAGNQFERTSHPHFENKPIKVSDWSQKYKLAIYSVSGIIITYFGVRILEVLDQIRNLLQIISSKL